MIAGIAVALVALGVGAAMIVTPAAESASSPATAGELEGSFTASERVLVDGEHFFARETIVDADAGEQRAVIAFEDVEYDHYWAGDGERYTKITTSSAQRLDDALEESDDQVVRELEGEYAAITRPPADVDSANDGPSSYVFPDRLVGSQLRMIAFEETNSTVVDGEPVEIHEPQTGWTAIDSEDTNREAMYVSNAGGEVHVGEGGRLHYANVTLERTDAETWGEYLLERDAWTTTLEYEARETAEDVRPEWVGDVPEE
ncbi:hypothetical protein B1756_13210 [Natrarchaeobaculum aegyptiacum]|uniref:Uncharacterized protein n=1 Tax=Natrarchaeobaculum aegyptiacum TaxID=745377 RepID=A0A2Z2HTQ6_9EURY|nr:hypothetical protein B1756_13210 [Natrarchaeobaculum aegyptiacum]